MKLSIIIPVFNEEANIPVLYERLQRAFSGTDIALEFIFINDGSRDQSLARIRELAGKDPSVKFIDFSRNFGHQVAVSAGLDYCSGDYAVIMDADLQDPPELIKEFISRAEQGFQVVYARRRSRQGEGFLKKTTAKLFYRILSRITSISIPLDTGDFRLVHRHVINTLKQMPERQKFIRGQIAWAGFAQTAIEYDRGERHSGKSGYTYSKMFRFALDGITSFSNLPLRFATIAGFVVSGVSFFIMLYALYSRFITRDYVPGWASLMLTVLFIGGIQLIGIGIIGEYVSRISENVRNRPLYVVRETNLEKSER